MSDPLMVWVVTAGCYSSAGVTGVYASAEAAMADQKDTVNGRDAVNIYGPKPVEWTQDKYGAWNNNGDWDDACTIEPYEVKGRQS